MGFFQKTFGFAESNYVATQKALQNIATFEFAPPTLTRDYWQEQCTLQVGNGKSISAGTFSMPSVEQLRSRVQKEVNLLLEHQNEGTATRLQSPITVRNMVGEARSLHSEPFRALLEDQSDPSSNNCNDFPPQNHYVFQAASQFNLLEFPSPSITPEQGIEDYIYDRTQGPACAVACAGGTAYRNYLVPMEMEDESDPSTCQQRGQTKSCQLNGLQLVEDYLQTSTTLSTVPWKVQNGYIEGQKQYVTKLNSLLESDPQLHETLVGKLQIGVQEDVGVTDCPLDLNCQVTQTYNSAISIGYSRLPDYLWKPMAKIVLQGTYEGTLLAAMTKALAHGNDQRDDVTVLLTKVGGGVFRNDDAWIAEAMKKAIQAVEELVTIPCGVGLDIRIVHFGEIQTEYVKLER